MNSIPCFVKNAVILREVRGCVLSHWRMYVIVSEDEFLVQVVMS